MWPTETRGTTVPKKTIMIVAAVIAIALAIGLAPQFLTPTTAAADEGSNTFTVQAGVVQPSLLEGTASGIGSGAYPKFVNLKTARVRLDSKKSATYLRPKSTSTKKLSIPATIKVKGKSYKITNVASYAFSGSKANNVTVGANVKTIGYNAFEGAKKLKTIKVKTSKLNKASFTNMVNGSKIKTVKLIGVTKTAKNKYKKWGKSLKVTVK